VCKMLASKILGRVVQFNERKLITSCVVDSRNRGSDEVILQCSAAHNLVRLVLMTRI